MVIILEVKFKDFKSHSRLPILKNSGLPNYLQRAGVTGFFHYSQIGGTLETMIKKRNFFKNFLKKGKIRPFADKILQTSAVKHFFNNLF